MIENAGLIGIDKERGILKILEDRTSQLVGIFKIRCLNPGVGRAICRIEETSKNSLPAGVYFSL